jgi:hypothetical protein
MDYADVQMSARLADNPEMVVDQDKVWLTSYQTELDGYAREDDRWILEPGDTALLDFDAFQDFEWIEVGVQNEGANPVDVTLVDWWGVRFTIPVPARSCMLLRCFKMWKEPDGPSLHSDLGTKVRVFAWGIPYSPPPP